MNILCMDCGRDIANKIKVYDDNSVVCVDCNLKRED